MTHPIYCVTDIEILEPYKIKIRFNDRSVQVIDFEPILKGEVFGPLRDVRTFTQVRIDPETQTLVWPNDADFDPATLHDWPKHVKTLKVMAKKWAAVEKSAPQDPISLMLKEPGSTPVFFDDRWLALR